MAVAVALGKKESFGALLWATRSFYKKYERPEPECRNEK